MKKTLILTFHRKKNYGAALQTYALTKTLKQISLVNVVDYNFKERQTIMSTLMPILKFNKYIKRMVNYNKFYNKYYPLTKKVTSKKGVQKICEDYDAIYCGSDQVWALDIIKDNKDIYFLNFDKKKNFICNSYAASIGTEDISEKNKLVLKKYLNNFDNISVREESARKILNELGFLHVKTTIDPTLLLNKEDYIIDFNLKKSKKRYLLVYMLEINLQIINVVKQTSEYLGLEIICFNNRNYFGKKCMCRSDCGPAEFLELFYNADFIITNSFHGTCFSIIFEKQFITILHTTKGTRQINLLSKLNLENQLFSEKEKIDTFIKNNINYKSVNTKLSSYRKDAKQYLKTSLGSEDEQN